MSKLNFETIESLSDKPENIVILLHGYGANGKDLLEIGKHLQPNLPDTLFVSPDGPQKCPLQPEGGFQWFNLPAYDGSSPIDMGKTFQESVTALGNFIQDMLSIHKLPLNKIFLLGFSQGTMLALKFALETSQEVGGVIGFSGRLMAPIKSESEVNSKPPVLLVHDEDDEVVPYSQMSLAEKSLKLCGIKVFTCTSKGIGHSISPVGLGVALHFITRELDKINDEE